MHIRFTWRDCLKTGFTASRISESAGLGWRWRNLCIYLVPKGFPCGTAGKESTCNAGDLGSIPGLGRSPGEGKGYPLQYSDLENPMERQAWWATVHGVAESLT